MPSEVIQCIAHIRKEQGMPDSLTFADHHGNEIKVHIPDTNHEDDKSYQLPDDATMEHSNDDFSFDNTNTHDCDDDDDDDRDAPGVALNDDEDLLEDNGLFDPWQPLERTYHHMMILVMINNNIMVMKLWCHLPQVHNTSNQHSIHH